MKRIALALAVVIAPPMTITACSDAQVAKFEESVAAIKAKALARLKLRSTQFVALVEKIAAKVPAGLADDLVAKARANDAEIQKATDLRAGLAVYARALADTGDKLLQLAEKVPVVGDYAEVLRAAVRVMHMIADRPEAAADDLEK